jgi:CBS domain-containing protein
LNEQQFRALCVSATCTVREALDTLERTAKGILLVLDSKGKLRRTLTDGDLRRAALARTPEDAFIAILPGRSRSRWASRSRSRKRWR